MLSLTRVRVSGHGEGNLLELLGFEVLGACEPKTKPYDPMAGRVPHAISR